MLGLDLPREVARPAMDGLILFFVALLAFDAAWCFWERRGRWREVATGRARIYTLRMLTGITDRQEITRRFGTPDPMFRFATTPDQVRGAQTRARRIFDQGWAEPALLGIAVAAAAVALLQLSATLAWGLVFAAFLYRICKAGYILLVLFASYRQMLHEGRAKLQYVRSQAG
jgi:hypothetical protein